MLIFGWGDRPTIIDNGSFGCPICKTKTNFIHLRHRRWMTFFFVPIIPLSKSFDTIACQKCQSKIPIKAIHGDSIAGSANARLSLAALFGMLLSFVSLLTFCIFIVAFPLAIISVTLGHLALRDIRLHRPNVDGRWQAITALALGYPALILSMLVGIFVLNSLMRSNPKGPEAIQSSDGVFDAPESGRFEISDSSSEALKAAEYEIASKRDKPAGRGNSPEAIKLANAFATRMKEVSD